MKSVALHHRAKRGTSSLFIDGIETWRLFSVLFGLESGGVSISSAERTIFLKTMWQNTGGVEAQSEAEFIEALRSFAAEKERNKSNRFPNDNIRKVRNIARSL